MMYRWCNMCWINYDLKLLCKGIKSGLKSAFSPLCKSLLPQTEKKKFNGLKLYEKAEYIHEEIFFTTKLSE